MSDAHSKRNVVFGETQRKTTTARHRPSRHTRAYKVVEEDIYDPSQPCRSPSIYQNPVVIGEGTYSTVYRVEKGGKYYAIKKTKENNTNFGTTQTTIREIRILKQCNHKNIVKLKEICVVEHSSSLYLVLEYIDYNLLDILRNLTKPLAPSKIKNIIFQLLQGVEYMHSKGIMHRDIKMANLLINQEGILKIADFGLSRYRISSDGPYTNNVVTRWYRAPELLLKSRHYTGAIDIWSVGCLFAELFLIRPLLPGDSEMDQLTRTVNLLGYPGADWPEFDELASKFPFEWDTQHQPKDLNALLPSMSSNALDMLKSMLLYDPNKRLTASEALAHPYFKEKPAMSPSNTILSSINYIPGKIQQDVAALPFISPLPTPEPVFEIETPSSYPLSQPPWPTQQDSRFSFMRASEDLNKLSIGSKAATHPHTGFAFNPFVQSQEINHPGSGNYNGQPSTLPSSNQYAFQFSSSQHPAFYHQGTGFSNSDTESFSNLGSMQSNLPFTQTQPTYTISPMPRNIDEFKFNPNTNVMPSHLIPQTIYGPQQTYSYPQDSDSSQNIQAYTHTQSMPTQSSTMNPKYPQYAFQSSQGLYQSSQDPQSLSFQHKQGRQTFSQGNQVIPNGDQGSQSLYQSMPMFNQVSSQGTQPFGNFLNHQTMNHNQQPMQPFQFMPPTSPDSPPQHIGSKQAQSGSHLSNAPGFSKSTGSQPSGFAILSMNTAPRFPSKPSDPNTSGFSFKQPTDHSKPSFSSSKPPVEHTKSFGFGKPSQQPLQTRSSTKAKPAKSSGFSYKQSKHGVPNEDSTPKHPQRSKFVALGVTHSNDSGFGDLGTADFNSNGIKEAPDTGFNSRKNIEVKPQPKSKPWTNSDKGSKQFSHAEHKQNHFPNQGSKRDYKKKESFVPKDIQKETHKDARVYKKKKSGPLYLSSDQVEEPEKGSLHKSLDSIPRHGGYHKHRNEGPTYRKKEVQPKSPSKLPSLADVGLE